MYSIVSLGELREVYQKRWTFLNILSYIAKLRPKRAVQIYTAHSNLGK